MSLILIIVILPALNIYLFILACKEVKKLDIEKFKKMFGVFYEDFEKKKIKGLLYMIVYFLRREIFILVAFSMANPKYEAS